MISNEDTIEKQIKLVILGEAACGKTSLASRYCHEEFTRQYYPTMGIDIFLKRTSVESSNVRVVIWDVSGNAFSSCLLDKYLYEANIVLLTYDITNGTSFLAIPTWYNAVLNAATSLRPTIAVVENKCDLEHQRSVSAEKQNKFVSDNGLTAYSVSTRTGENVTFCFQKVLAQYLGIKLSKLEQEGYNKVLKAEIVTGHHPVIHYQTSSSSICSVQ